MLSHFVAHSIYQCCKKYFLMSQVAQSVNGQIHVIQQDGDGSVVSLQPQQVQPQQEGQEDGDGTGVAGDQVILDIPVDMLPLEMQPQNLLQPKPKPFKIYRCGITTNLLPKKKETPKKSKNNR